MRPADADEYRRARSSEARFSRTVFPLDKDLHGCRQSGSNPSAKLVGARLSWRKYRYYTHNEKGTVFSRAPLAIVGSGYGATRRKGPFACSNS